MPLTPHDIFVSDAPFEEKAIRAFHFQLLHNNVYKEFVHSLGVDPKTVHAPEQIPFLPVEFFKTHKVLAAADHETVFASSSTTGVASMHFVHKLDIYIESFTRCFRQFYPADDEFCILALLPSYLERGNSSLVFMCDYLIKKSKHPLSGFYLNNLEELSMHLDELKDQPQPVMLVGVTYALLDLAESYAVNFPDLIIVETGGMKGRRREMIREEVHHKLINAFNVNAIHSEYGMTELLSQAWSQGQGIYKAPSWMKVYIRDINDPFFFPGDDVTGGINVIDLANIYSCPFLATQDLGRTHEGSFQVLGRFDNSELRGCNLMVG